MTGRLTFGTDGVRGVANVELTPEFALAVGRAAARVIGGEHASWVVGRDTRVSGPLLQAAVMAGLASEGADVIDAGVVPTPAIAHACATRDCPGVVVSASHNPFPDNGLKVFAPGGHKLDDGTQARLEQELGSFQPDEQKVAADVGRITTDTGVADEYAAHLAQALEGRTLDGLRVVLDAANGAASALAGEVFRRAGADVTVLHAQPDGTNINHGCGSTHPEALQASVVDAGADIGLAFDGDADRVIAVAPSGALVDGDVMLALHAVDLRARGRLKDDTVVVTVMSNLGLRLAMATAGIEVVETKVGDRYVLEALEARGLSLGGEQSGHVIFRDLATTGDGLLTGLLLCDLVARAGAGQDLDRLAAGAMTRLPQVLTNVPVGDARGALADAGVRRAVDDVERELGDAGRVVLRPSGTEPLVRVMVEAPTEDQARAAADRIATAVAASAVL